MKIKKFLFGSLPESDSKVGNLNPLDFKKVGRQLVMLIAGTVLAVIIDFSASLLTTVDLGQYQFVALLILNSGLLEMARRVVAEHFPTKK